MDDLRAPIIVAFRQLLTIISKMDLLTPLSLGQHKDLLSKFELKAEQLRETRLMDFIWQVV